MIGQVSAPQWGEHRSSAPPLVRGYATRNAAGRWCWSAAGPAEAGVVTRASGRMGLDVGGASTWDVVLTGGGAPIIYGS